MKAYPTLFILLTISLFACANNSKDNENRKQVRLETSKGDILIELYNETPQHRDNFIKLTEKHFFDGTLFHRVINNFMVQGGDPDSKNAKPGEALGNGGPGYDIPAEIKEGLFHKKGVIAAARLGDNINPERKSSGSQFYLVEGNVFTTKQLENMEKSKNTPMRKKLIETMKKEHEAKLDSLIALQKETGDTLSLNNFVDELNAKIDKRIEEDGFHFTDEQKNAYTTVGGVPHLDNAYTVFGEIVEGIEVVEKISDVKTDKRDRPLENVIILSATVVN
ncbi:peptidyl-prolyl cis-trans isomerase B (cyclophilin B) [Balneicella halophila]|uniref:Peptidyl-prolyl cis-trans isomerase n=2 Tax=Balneicella halophila TaxID=1537566 RepID=A0A7L4UQ18_BALHA|nr:peptidyl-prolyl cis-trans isomerase B (cyclophilin B) [Balneicella halophila]